MNHNQFGALNLIYTLTGHNFSYDPLQDGILLGAKAKFIDWRSVYILQEPLGDRGNSVKSF